MLKTIEIIAGDDVELDFPITDGNGDPVDITGCLFWLTAKTAPEDADADALLQVSSGAGTITIIDAAGGVPRAAIAGSLTKGKTLGRYYADIQMKTAAGKIETTERFILKLVYEVTQAET